MTLKHFIGVYYMIISHVGPLWGLFRYTRGAQKGQFGLKQTLTGRKASEHPRGARFSPNCCQLVWLSWNHGYHTLWPCIGPFWAPRDTKRARFGPKCPFWGSQRSSEGPRGPDLVHTAADWSDWVEIMVATHFGLVSGLFWASRDTKNAHFGPQGAQIGPKFKIVADPSCDLSKFAQERHSANGKHISIIWCTNSEKIPKNYHLGH